VRSGSFRSIESQVLETRPVITPYAQRKKSLVWAAALVMYSGSFSCAASNSKAAAFTAGMSLEALLVLADMLVSTSHRAGKKVADPG
jgi:hypothetical protein